jgi:hypothetical protein
MVNLKVHGEGPADFSIMPIFVRRCVEENKGRRVHDMACLEPGRLPRLRDTIKSKPKKRRRGATSLASKVTLAIKNARYSNLDFRGVVIVVDRDGPERGGDRLAKMERGRERAEADGYVLPCALGIAIETAEAWLLADGQALENALGLDETPSISDPEGLYGRKGSEEHPKGKLNSYLDRDSQNRTHGECIADIAERSDIPVIRDKCKRGFAPFQDEVTERIAPFFVT